MPSCLYQPFALTLLFDEGNVDELKRLPDGLLDLQDVLAHLSADAGEGCCDQAEGRTRLHHGPGAAGTNGQPMGCGQVAGQVGLQSELLGVVTQHNDTMKKG